MQVRRALAAGVLLNLVFLERAGFVIASTVLFWLTSRAFDTQHPARDALLAVGVAVGSYLLFVRVLGVPLPATLAAAIIDLDENHGLTEADDQERLRARELFAEQLVCMIGEDEAARVLGGLPPSDGDLDIAASECAKDAAQINAR